MYVEPKLKKEMKKLIISLLLFAVSFQTGISKADTLLAAYLKDSTWYFIDTKGEEIFKTPAIDEVRGFSEGLIRVTMKKTETKNYWAFLNTDGTVAFIPRTSVILDFHDGMALSARKNSWSKSLQIFGFYDKNGNEVISHKYDDATNFSNGLAYVFNKETSGFINKKGEMVIPLPNKAANLFSEGLAAVNTADFKVGYIDTSGKMVIDFTYDEGQPFSEGKAAVHYTGYFGFIDRKGHFIAEPTFDFAHAFKENHAFVAMAEDRLRYARPRWGFIDTTGKLIADFKYHQVNDFSEGLASVQNAEGKWGFINYQDSLVIPAVYDKLASFKDGLAWAEITSENKYGFINKNGDWVILLDEPEKVFDLRLNKKVK